MTEPGNGKWGVSLLSTRQQFLFAKQGRIGTWIFHAPLRSLVGLSSSLLPPWSSSNMRNKKEAFPPPSSRVAAAVVFCFVVMFAVFCCCFCCTSFCCTRICCCFSCCSGFSFCSNTSFGYSSHRRRPFQTLILLSLLLLPLFSSSGVVEVLSLHS